MNLGAQKAARRVAQSEAPLSLPRNEQWIRPLAWSRPHEQDNGETLNGTSKWWYMVICWWLCTFSKLCSVFVGCVPFRERKQEAR